MGQGAHLEGRGNLGSCMISVPKVTYVASTSMEHESAGGESTSLSSRPTANCLELAVEDLTVQLIVTGC